MLYFSYGSNMSFERMKERCPHHQLLGKVMLKGHRMIFPRVSQSWGGGVASIEPSNSAVVWGLLFELTYEDIRSLDAYEGFKGPAHPNNAYDRDVVLVQKGSTDVCALTYIARPAQARQPTAQYMGVLIKAALANGFPQKYIADLQKIRTGT